ncbi:MAG: AAA family ATPase [Cocleimonas sp.]|nr:AAA family ATPase [Cocleimonas sp.]
MKILLYNDLNISTINGFEKLRNYLEKDNFHSADVKKIGDNLYRARLNHTDRLLFSIYRYKENAYALILEHIKNHRYEKSRFLRRGIKIDEHRIPTITTLEEVKQEALSFLDTNSTTFNVLDKPISFDTLQHDIYQQALPLIIVGPAGSGKTCLMLEKIKKMQGDILYVSQSPYLVDTSKALYQANNYINNNQQLQFLSFKEFIESIKIPTNTVADTKIFQQWFYRIKQSSPIKDGYKLLEEIRGVITGNMNPLNDYKNEATFLNRATYLSLGVKQSIFLQHEKNAVYDLFERYLTFIQTERYYDTNLICHAYLSLVTKKYDYIIIDEVQDLTNIQLALVLKTLRTPSHFLFCGDANQVVHPNFFSWSKLKALFFKKYTQRTLLYTLEGSYRNATQVTQLANKILKLKTQRFGSLDKESHYLMTANDALNGNIALLKNIPSITKELNEKTKNTTAYAVITLDELAKKEAEKIFSTPLIFTIQEAKGLEYEHIILFDFISTHETRYQKIAQGIQPNDIEQAIKYARSKDKTDKSAEAYKFHINALYVATTRAIKTIYWLETKTNQPILRLLGLHHAKKSLHLKKLISSTSEWQQQADTLERQGKQQQAKQIRQTILQQQAPHWTVYNEDNIQDLLNQALNKQQRKAKLTLFEYALVYDDKLYQNALIQIDFKPALNPSNGYDLLHKKYFMSYQSKSLQAVTQLIHRYGVDFRNTFNQTPLMIATKYGNIDLIHRLIEQKANKSLANNKGHNAFQIALYLSWKDKQYAQEKLLSVFLALSPDSMELRINNQTIKLDKHRTEFFLINLMMVLFYETLPHKMIFTGGGFTPHDLIEALANFPSHLLYKKLYEHNYLSEVLATHKMHSDNPHSLNLFYRVTPDNYLINPNIALKIDDQWIAIYDLLSFDQLSMKHERKLGMIDVDRFYSGVLEDMKIQYKTVLGII